jgi:hypothetical protein
MVQLVFPEDVDPRGTLYGGRIMYWIATAVTLTASRCARGPVAPGVMDDFDFFHPVFLGEIGGGPAAGSRHGPLADAEPGLWREGESRPAQRRARVTAQR